MTINNIINSIYDRVCLNKILAYHKANSKREVKNINGYEYAENFQPFYIGKYRVSIQASSSAYSEPRIDLPELKSYNKIEMLITDTTVDTTKEGAEYDDFVRPWIKWGHRNEKGYVVYDDERLDIGWEGDWHLDPEDDWPEARTTTAGYITWEQASGVCDFLEEKVDQQQWIENGLKYTPEMLEVAYNITPESYEKMKDKL